ncbi:MAG: hypothetical protein WBH99_01865 [Azovibrio sp.]|uniref:hypothetical protein n=1 Tax=Azovibrio sp. TaxID=1872673 RepID=UPI003C74BB09
MASERLGVLDDGGGKKPGALFCLAHGFGDPSAILAIGGRQARLSGPDRLGLSRFDEKSAVLEIVWLSVIEAMGVPWSDTKARALFQDAYSELLRNEASWSRAIQEEFELLEITSES